MNQNLIKNWQTKKLGEVCDFLSGLWKGKIPPYIKVGVIRNTNITKDGKLDDTNIAYLYVEKKQFENRKLLYGDIILEKSGGGPKQPVGRVIIFNKREEEFSFSNFTTAIRIKNKKVLDFNFLHKFLFLSYISGITESMQSHSTGIRNLDSKSYKNIEIPLPPFGEQLRIVKILDKVFGEIERIKKNTEKNLQNAKDLFESYLRSIFTNSGWAEKTLKEISIEFSRGKSKHRPRNDKKLYGGKYPFIQTGDIRNSDHFINKYSQTYNEVGLKQSKLWPKGTICITIAANIAETGLLNFSSCFPDSVIGLIVDPKKANEEFVEYLLFFFKTKIKSKGKGSAQANINMGTFEYEKFPIPNLLTQKSIIKKLDLLSEKTKRLEEIYKQKLVDLEELKKTILKQAFEGKL